MDGYPMWQAVITGLVAFGAVVVTIWPPQGFYSKLIVVFLFAVFGVVAIWLQSLKDKADKGTQNELLNWQRGDPRKPPYVDYTTVVFPETQVAQLSFNMSNDSDFPAYEMSVRVWEPANMPKDPTTEREILARSIVVRNFASLAPHVVADLATVELQPTVDSKTFAAQYTCRVGSFMEDFKAEKVNGNWLFAIRVRRADAQGEVVLEKVDSNFPRNTKGEVQWQ